MVGTKIPEFLNSEEKYNNIIHQTKTVKQFEEIFHILLQNEELSLTEILKIMRNLEHDITVVHGNFDVCYLLEAAHAIIRYLICITNEEKNSEVDNLENICDY